MSDTTSKEPVDRVREVRLRNIAKRRGMFLSRSARRDPFAVGYGRYHLYDRADRATRIQLWPHSEDGASMDEVEAFLAAGGSIRTARTGHHLPGMPDTDNDTAPR